MNNLTLSFYVFYALRTMGQNLNRPAQGQDVIASGTKQSLPENRDCFVAYRSSQ
jgi:hypothetical protein